MEQRRLGNTGLAVSALSLGGAAFGQQYGPVSAEEVAEAVQLAVASGINLIDTSAYYGSGTSESLLGEALHSRGLRDCVSICTKAGRLGQDQFDFSAAGMRACFEASLNRLQTDHVEILLAHDIEFAPDRQQVFHETAAVLHQLKAEGKCRFVGMSAYPLEILREAIEQCQLDVVISYCHFNLQNQRLLTELLPVAEAHGVGVLNASPLGMGLLTLGGPQPWHPGQTEVKAACARAAAHCAERGHDLATLGMQFCLAEPRIASTITGAARAEELRRNLTAITASLDLELLAEVQSLLAPVQGWTWPSGRA